jgi:phosphoribosyl-ATP pyrophosphohydrolase/phosphoribosyl-AMP cyclohydrolase/histidinol dehydrogenase
MKSPLLRSIPAADIPATRYDPVDEATLARAGEIVRDVREHGRDALERYAHQLDRLGEDQPLIVDQAELQDVLEIVSAEDLALLERTAKRIERFARAQLDALREISVPVDGGQAGHRIFPLATAGCYAPGGRFPLPSTVLMTAVTARVAGVKEVWVASPSPGPITLAAAAIANASGVVRAGGAQAIAAFAYGADSIPACDAIVGPGNRWVTAAKQIVAGRVAIDMLAGPSELVILADDTAEHEMIAADLLAQAEHDPDAMPVLVTTDSNLVPAVNSALQSQLADLPTAETARAALEHGFAVVAGMLDEAIEVVDQLAPEHLQVLTRDAQQVADRLSRYGGIFIGPRSAEVLGDYGAGPNHTLPTGGTARFVGGLSVLNFLRINTWLRIDQPDASLLKDATRLARLEGLEAHARAAERRQG